MKPLRYGLLPALLLGWQSLAGATPVSVTDDTGRVVTLPAPAARIVTLSPHGTELVFTAGAGDRLVAVAPYSEFPREAERLPTIGGLGGLDRERLLALAPDLVIAWDSGNRATDLLWLEGLGLAVYRSEPRALGDIADNLRDIGRLAGTTEVAEAAAARYLEALDSACPEPPQPIQSAFIRLAERPLITVGGGHWLDQAIRRAGLRNVYADLPAGTPTVSEESLLARHPDRVLYLAYPGVTADSATAIGLDPDLWSRPGPRLPEGIARLCRALHAQP